MSGIAGIIHFDGKPVDPGLIERMTGAMAHRGPDGIHHWVNGSVALGQCMLRTTPESMEEVQPLANEDESLVLVMDRRVDNRDELSRVFKIHGVPLSANTDAELVLGAYRLWGEDSPRHLIGDYAFVLWNSRREHFFCARDRLGVKPLYYYCNQKYIAFASDEEAFLGLPGVSFEPNDDLIATIFVPNFEVDDLNRSWLRDILKLPPGQTLIVERSGRRIQQCYWQLEPLEESRFGSDAECEEAFDAVFAEAVRCRLRVLSNPALMLSGGIDSASIAGMARRILLRSSNLELHTYSAVHDDADSCDETKNIRLIVKGHENQARLFSVPSCQWEGADFDLAEAAWTHAHPVGNSILLAGMMYLSAARNGHRVMYDGIEGDLATYAPDLYISILMRTGNWRLAWTEARSASVNNTYLRHLSPIAILSLCIKEIYVPVAAKRFKRRVWNIRRKRPLNSSLISRDFVENLRLLTRLEDQISHARTVAQLSDTQQHIRAFTRFGIAAGMEGYDGVAARYGVEPRHPWSDQRLVEFCLRLPLRQKVRDGWTKYLVRKTMSRLLDADVAWHAGKDSLGWHLVRRVMEQSREQVQSIVETAQPALEPYVDLGALRVLLDRFRIGEVAYLDVLQIYLVVTLALWLGRIR